MFDQIMAEHTGKVLGLSGGGIGAAMTYLLVKCRWLSSDLKDLKKHVEEEVEKKIESSVQEKLCALTHKNLDETVRGIKESNSNDHKTMFKKMDNLMEKVLELRG